MVQNHCRDNMMGRASQSPWHTGKVLGHLSSEKVKTSVLPQTLSVLPQTLKSQRKGLVIAHKMLFSPALLHSAEHLKLQN